jgi:SAM-dependent methyltransferase
VSGSPKLVSSNWDRAYKGGKYDYEGPVPLVADVIDLISREGLQEAKGFYPGCGNGRNLIPLLEAGLHIEAEDISEVAIRQLKDKYQGVKARVGDFMFSHGSEQYDYLLSIQLFQHVDERGPQPLFDRAEEVLRSDGLFILRVNSIHTQIVEDHEKIGAASKGGFTIQYKTGQKSGQRIHFYSAEEIHRLTMGKFDIIMPLREEFMPREDGTHWAQWETILKKR